MRLTGLFICLVAFLAVSCMEDIQPVVKLSKNPIVLGGNVTVTNADTKAPVIGTTFPTNRSMFVVAYPHNSYEYFIYNEQFSYNSTDGGWKANTTKYWPASGTTDFLAYSCDGITPQSLQVWNNTYKKIRFWTGDISTAQADVMFGFATNCSYSPSSHPTLTFKHALSLISFSAACPDKDWSSSPTQGVRIESIGIKQANWSGVFEATINGDNLDITRVNYSNYNGNSVIIPNSTQICLTKNLASVGDNFLVIPHTGSYRLEIIYRIYTGNYSYNQYTYTSLVGPFEIGKKYSYAIEITTGGTVTVIPSYEEWADVTNNWLYAEGNSVVQQGPSFTLAEGQPVWWRKTDSSPYELLTYVEGTWGNSVKLESTGYYVTVAASGSSYNITYQGKPVGLRVEPSSVNLIGYQSIDFKCYAILYDGAEEDVTNDATWDNWSNSRYYNSPSNYYYQASGLNSWKYIERYRRNDHGGYSFYNNASANTLGYVSQIPCNVVNVQYGGFEANVSGYMSPTAIDMYVEVPGEGWQNGPGPYYVMSNSWVKHFKRCWGPGGYIEVQGDNWIGDPGSTMTLTASIDGVTSNSIQVIAAEYRLTIYIRGDAGEVWDNSHYYDLRISYYSWIPSYEIYWDFAVTLSRYINGELDTSFTPIDVTADCEVDLYDLEDYVYLYEYDGTWHIASLEENNAEEMIGGRYEMIVTYNGDTHYCVIYPYY